MNHDYEDYLREKVRRLEEQMLRDRYDKYEYRELEPVKRKKKMKKIKTVDTLQIFRKKSIEEFSSESAVWFIKDDGVWIHSPKKVNAENSVYFPMATIDKIKVHREKINSESGLQKYLEKNLK